MDGWMQRALIESSCSSDSVGESKQIAMRTQKARAMRDAYQLGEL
jgi:hypothetical protein